ncbi:MAG: hypothetical protein J6S23_01405 [Clostridia bacterium]|nr:hypothetical protein [Clostridia bacterium]
MLRIDVKLPLNFTQNDIKIKICSILPIEQVDIRDIQILKLSLDLSDKSKICHKAAIGVCLDCELEEKFKLRKKVCSPVDDLSFSHKLYDVKNLRPVVIGAGPCGLFAALTLAEVGARPIVLERGLPVDEREVEVEKFIKLGILNPECNVQFGEGGAGTYSDGKLKSGALNKYKLKILNEFIEAGATNDITYSSTAHLGTDKLGEIVKNIRTKIINLGGSFIFGAKFTKFVYKNDKLEAVKYIKDGNEIILPCTDVILAIGHSARDTITSLYERGFQMIPKGFGVGLRIEHPREYINELVYGKNYDKSLETATYHLVTHLKNGRSVYSFCMCPGGTVVPATNEQGGIVTNGMSVFNRDANNSNCALLVSVTPDDFGSDHVLAGLDFQRKIEKRAFSVSNSYRAPIAKMKDILESKMPNSELGRVQPSYPMGTIPCSPDEYLPEYITSALAESFRDFDDWMSGFYLPDAVLTGPETRTTAPIRMLRNEQTREAIGNPHVYPAGEGAGYAGGIVTSAYDGMLSALTLLEKFIID